MNAAYQTLIVKFSEPISKPRQTSLENSSGRAKEMFPPL